MCFLTQAQALSKFKCLLITAAQCGSLLRHCGTTRSLTNTKRLHAHTITSGLLFFDHSARIRSNLIATYAVCGDATIARLLFDDLPQRKSLLWNFMIRAYSQNGLSTDALRLFVEMLSSGDNNPDNFTFPFVLKACAEMSLLNMGMSIHCRALATGFDSDTYVQNSLLAMYMNCGKTEMARLVFDRMQEQTVVSWNTMISGYLRNGLAEESLAIFDWMMDVDEKPDHATLVSVLPACAHLKDLQRGRGVHDLLEEKGLGNYIPVKNSLMDMYAKCGRLVEARLVFDEMGEKDVVSWTAMIVGYLSNGDATSVLALGHRMQLEGVKPNSVTLAALLSASASLSTLKHGKCLHGWAIRCRLESDVMVETALIDMYAKCNRMDLSFRVFLKSTKKGTVPWNALITGHVHNRLANKAIKLFKQMLMEEGVYPDCATLISLLPAYADLADLWQAKNIHCYLISSGFHPSVETATGLIDIYSKCGSLDSAHELFDKIPEKVKDTVAWSAIIAGYGMHGYGGVAVSLFYQMVQSGVKPNEVTFTSVLHACSHAGMVDEGLRLFKCIIDDHQMRPPTDHYTCIVDLLGRAGRLEEAYELITMMPFEPNHAVWGALLGACVIHEDAKLGEVAAKQLFELEPDNTGNYVLMAKIYAAVGRWKDAENMRSMMSAMGLRKTPAHSLIEIRNAVNT
ncbi:pentatricopeptide repeat-containing protein At5g39350 [Macadamia integrifolia]|uniref:pentatricopeptide repeat-containing protein At5g39350 n=1 Tax=Macadamia integrifolia TaxID=60698 RepID=UPI001C4F0289|nr:pentatricopeptide repeat-containing protein At5g39350 [Macadamia integrifolia]